MVSLNLSFNKGKSRFEFLDPGSFDRWVSVFWWWWCGGLLLLLFLRRGGVAAKLLGRPALCSYRLITACTDLEKIPFIFQQYR